MRGRRGLLLLTLAVTLAGQDRGRGGSSLPAAPVVATMPTFRPVTGPGPLFPALQALPPDEDLSRFKYITREYFVSGIARGQPYTTRILVRRPTDPKKFSGI